MTSLIFDLTSLIPPRSYSPGERSKLQALEWLFVAIFLFHAVKQQEFDSKLDPYVHFDDVNSTISTTKYKTEIPACTMMTMMVIMTMMNKQQKTKREARINDPLIYQMQ